VIYKGSLLMAGKRHSVVYRIIRGLNGLPQVLRIGQRACDPLTKGETFAGAGNAGTVGVTYDEYTP